MILEKEIDSREGRAQTYDRDVYIVSKVVMGDRWTLRGMGTN